MRALISLVLLCLMHNASAQCNPVITPSGSTTFCDGNSVILNASLGDTYQWYLNGNLIGGAQGSSYMASTAGSYTVEVDSVGCVNMSPAVVVTVNFPPAQPGPISGPIEICLGSTYTYTIDPVPGATSYHWSGGTGSGWQNFGGIISSPTITDAVGDAGSNTSPDATVGVTAINACGSSLSSVLNVHAYSPVVVNGFNNDPDFTYGGEARICPYSPGVLNAYSSPAVVGYSGPATYQWYRNNVLLAGETGYHLTVSKGGSYKVIITTGNVCHATYQKNFIHQNVPTPTIESLTPDPMCDGGVAVLKINFDMDGYDGTDYHWWWLHNGNNTGMYNNTYYFATAPGAYSLGLEGYFQDAGLFEECPDVPTLATVTISNTQAIPVSVTQNNMTLSATPGFVSYQWYQNSTPITGATNQDYTMTTWGNYFVLATDANGCVSQSNIVLDVNNANKQDANVQVYPNPNTGAFTIQAKLPVHENTAIVNVYDVAGKIVMSKEIPVKNGVVEEIIDINNYATGLYFLKLTSGSFNKVVSIVKQ